MFKKFRNRSEDKLQREIRAAVSRYGAELHEKVRIADLIDISFLNSGKLGTYALQAHFDFVLVDDNQEPVFAIEFDGPGHDSLNDKKKDAICRQAQLPLFRVYSFERVREINAFTLVRYLVDLVFHAREFLRMKGDGVIPHDEPFMLSSFIKPDAKSIFDSEFDFVANANGKLSRALTKAAMTDDFLPHLSISKLVVIDQNHRIKSFTSINSSKGPIVGTGSLRVKVASFGFLEEIGTIMIEIAQFADGMAADDLLGNIQLVAEGHGHVVDTEEMLAEIGRLKSLGYTILFGVGGSRSDVDLVGTFDGRKGT